MGKVYTVEKLKGFIAIEGIDGSGKSTLVTRLHNLLTAYDKPVYSFSISDLCKTGHADKQVDVAYEDIVKFDHSRQRVLNTLNRIKELANSDSSDCILCYDKLMKDYLSVMRVYSRIIKTYMEAGYTIIADRWQLSSLAYNNLVHGTVFNKIHTFKGYKERPKLRIDPSKDEHDIYNSSLQDLKLNFVNVLEPNLIIYLDIPTTVAVERISKREKSVDGVFETKLKLDDVQSAYNFIIDTYKNIDNKYEYLFNVEELLVIDGNKDTNNILLDIMS